MSENRSMSDFGAALLSWLNLCGQIDHGVSSFRDIEQPSVLISAFYNIFQKDIKCSENEAETIKTRKMFRFMYKHAPKDSQFIPNIQIEKFEESDEEAMEQTALLMFICRINSFINVNNAKDAIILNKNNGTYDSSNNKTLNDKTLNLSNGNANTLDISFNISNNETDYEHYIRLFNKLDRNDRQLLSNYIIPARHCYIDEESCKIIERKCEKNKSEVKFRINKYQNTEVTTRKRRSSMPIRTRRMKIAEIRELSELFVQNKLLDDEFSLLPEENDQKAIEFNKSVEQEEQKIMQRSDDIKQKIEDTLKTNEDLKLEIEKLKAMKMLESENVSMEENIERNKETIMKMKENNDKIRNKLTTKKEAVKNIDELRKAREEIIKTTQELRNKLLAIQENVALTQKNNEEKKSKEIKNYSDLNGDVTKLSDQKDNLRREILNNVEQLKEEKRQENGQIYKKAKTLIDLRATKDRLIKDIQNVAEKIKE